MNHHVPTWRETGQFLTPAELRELTEEQRVQYQIDSAPHTEDELDEMPEPHQSIFRRQLAALRARHEDRAAS